jgi:hypothetical protein
VALKAQPITFDTDLLCPTAYLVCRRQEISHFETRGGRVHFILLDSPTIRSAAAAADFMSGGSNCMGPKWVCDGHLNLSLISTVKFFVRRKACRTRVSIDSIAGAKAIARSLKLQGVRA